MNKAKYSVTVLMSTYNGAKYLSKQIDSILNQCDIDVKLIIRDDGSSDDTLGILRSYEEKHPNIKVLFEENVGVGKSFIRLLSESPDDNYYAFADQDDIWLPDKLIRAVEFIEMALKTDSMYERKCKGGYNNVYSCLSERDKETFASNPLKKMPVLYASNSTLVDCNLNYIGERLNSSNCIDFLNCFNKNVLFGSTMVFNRQLKEVCCKYPVYSDRVLKRKNHDAWVAYCAFIKGIVLYDPDSRILYRQHDDNVVGGIEPKGVLLIHDKINRLFTAKNKGIRGDLARDLIKAFGQEMDNDIAYHLDVIASANNISGIHRLLHDNDVIDAFGESGILLVLRCIFGWI